MVGRLQEIRIRGCNKSDSEPFCALPQAVPLVFASSRRGQFEPEIPAVNPVGNRFGQAGLLGKDEKPVLKFAQGVINRKILKEISPRDNPAKVGVPGEVSCQENGASGFVDDFCPEDRLYAALPRLFVKRDRTVEVVRVGEGHRVQPQPATVVEDFIHRRRCREERIITS
jgi:hypothetical protein